MLLGYEREDSVEAVHRFIIGFAVPAAGIRVMVMVMNVHLRGHIERLAVMRAMGQRVSPQIRDV